jgi:hypothetical protein
MALKPMARILDTMGLRLNSVSHYAIHGGTLGLFIKRKDADGYPFPIPDENITAEMWTDFHNKSIQQQESMSLFVRGAVASGKRICGYGASAKSAVWINACGWNRRDIAFVLDNTPLKCGKFISGTDIPVTDPGALLRDLPDFAILFAWNFKDEILEKEKLYRQKGGKFVLPHTCEIV